ncbi:MAG: hypothetical protein GY714_31915 [Desulfobacterales bacterium]|nr:hypothetical protein [Desulfobacterales bacterium]
MKKIILTILILMFSQNLFATELFNTNYVEVTYIKVWPAQIDIYLNETPKCPNPNQGLRYLLPKENKMMFSLFLTALTSGKKVSVRYSCSDTGYATIYGARISKDK